MLRVHLTYGICVFAFICCTSSQGILTATNITGYGGETTTFTCSSPDIAIGNSYTLLKDTIPIYASTSEGQIVNEKYNASAVNGEIKLNILNTNISDAGKYSCNHNFVDASGYVSVAFRPENIIAVATMFNNGLLLTATATKVFPSDSAISNVTCIKPDKMVAVLQSVGNAVNSNSDIPYLYDISWNGTTTELLAGRVQCTVTLVTVETFDTTIFVSIEAEPDSTSEKLTVEGIIGILLSVVFVVCIVIFIICSYKKKEFCFKEDEKKIQERNGP